MLGKLVIAYLFLAGTGAGGIAVVSCIDLLVVREPFGMLSSASFNEKNSVERLMSYADSLSCFFLIGGILCLIFDLGSPDKSVSLFFGSQFTLMNLGAWSLLILAGLAAVLALARVLYLPWIKRKAMIVLEIGAIVFAVVVAFYAGLLLSVLTGVHFWQTIWVPLLFFFSSFSCGCAILLTVSVFVALDKEVLQIRKMIIGTDIIFIVLEILAATCLLAFSLTSNRPEIVASARMIIQGDAALPWWLGFSGCGIAVPLLVEAIIEIRGQLSFESNAGMGKTYALAMAGILVLIGGLSLRWTIVNVGMHRELELQDPVIAYDVERMASGEGFVTLHEETHDDDMRGIPRVQEGAWSTDEDEAKLTTTSLKSTKKDREGKVFTL